MHVYRGFPARAPDFCFPPLTLSFVSSRPPALALGYMFKKGVLLLPAISSGFHVQSGQTQKPKSQPVTSVLNIGDSQSVYVAKFLRKHCKKPSVKTKHEATKSEVKKQGLFQELNA